MCSFVLVTLSWAQDRFVLFCGETQDTGTCWFSTNLGYLEMTTPRLQMPVTFGLLPWAQGWLRDGVMLDVVVHL